MVFHPGGRDSAKQSCIDAAFEIFIQEKTASFAIDQSGKRIKLSKRPCNHSCYFLWPCNLYSFEPYQPGNRVIPVDHFFCDAYHNDRVQQGLFTGTLSK